MLPVQLSTMSLRITKVMLFLICLIPLGRLVILAFIDGLGVNPIEFITRSTGTWTLVAILTTLSVTPLRRLTGMNWLLRLRRMLGLFAFFYASLHLTTYLWLDQFFDPAAIIKDIVKRPFITVGITAWLLLLPLAITSTNGMMKRLGRQWGRLHKAVYLIGILGVLHYWWLVKLDVTEPTIYATVLAVLLGVRIWHTWRERSAKARATVKLQRTVQ
ncbi:protein-methionine-sulfoxide reductase heme-binding subunit MsrQ [Chitinivorax sp. B]|uniref:sulfite oxidase heme-binding subunit YedZ n=1 Tax=Chitinivorax sp. B TaxID=2502235 RepID=UPI0010F842AA|nr:protein-methionine-sulfoxide reductase heme-binding subunit MsrQ [Chitinivorax sp. B]